MDRQGQRDMMFCHQCENEWYRDEHGLTCPECQSEFTEIIEPDHDPRNDRILIDDDDDDDVHDLPDLHPLHDHNPWEPAPDPDEGDVEQFQMRQNGPNSYTLTGTFYRTVPGREGQQQAIPTNPMNELLRNFGTMFQTIAGPNARNQRTGDTPQGGGGARVQVITRGGPRFTYTSTARLAPGDPNHPQPHIEPMDDLHHMLGTIFAGMGAPHPPHEGPGGGGAGPPPNPFAALLSTIFHPANAAHGDAVYTQEALDRVISQLMEQNASGNAPGPASDAAIANLPKITVTKEMLGDSDTPRGECSICMDEVGVGEVVTKLPCTHWFHQTCIEAWLREHDTCPHCRKGIEEVKGAAGSTGSTTAAGSSASASPTRDRYMPGAWAGSHSGGAYGAGTQENPWVVPESPTQERRRPSSSRHASSSARSSHDSGGGQGFGERVRNLFRGSSEHGR